MINTNHQLYDYKFKNVNFKSQFQMKSDSLAADYWLPRRKKKYLLLLVRRSSWNISSSIWFCKIRTLQFTLSILLRDQAPTASSRTAYTPALVPSDHNFFLSFFFNMVTSSNLIDWALQYSKNKQKKTCSWAIGNDLFFPVQRPEIDKFYLLAWISCFLSE